MSCPTPGGVHRVCTEVGVSSDASGATGMLAEQQRGGGWPIQPAPAGTSYNDLRAISCPTTRMCMTGGMDYRHNDANLSNGPHVALAKSGTTDFPDELPPTATQIPPYSALAGWCRVDMAGY